MKRFFWTCALVIFFSASVYAGQATRSGSGTQHSFIPPDSFDVTMWCGATSLQQQTLPSDNLDFGVAATQIPFGQQPLLPPYYDTTYGCGNVTAVAIAAGNDEQNGGDSAKAQAVIKYDLASGGIPASGLSRATFSGIVVNDLHRTANITTPMTIGLYGVQDGEKANGGVDEDAYYPLGTKLGEFNVDFNQGPGQAFNFDVTAFVKADLQAGRPFTGFILYAENVRLGSEEVSFELYPTLLLESTSITVPTLSQVGILLLGFGLIGSSVWHIRRARKLRQASKV